MSWISKVLEKKILDEVGKQLNLEVSKEGKIDYKAHKQCQFCKAMIPEKEAICPKCNLCLE